MDKDKIKHHIINAINYDTDMSYSYEDLCKQLYDNQYRRIMKVPVDLMFSGIIERYKYPVVTIDLIKEVIIDALQYSGIETTFVDEDWDKLEYVECTGSWGNIELKLNTDKLYMSEFFEH